MDSLQLRSPFVEAALGAPGLRSRVAVAAPARDELAATHAALSAALARTAHDAAADVDASLAGWTATALAGSMHTWRVANRFPVPGGVVAADFRRAAPAATVAGVEADLAGRGLAAAAAAAATVSSRLDDLRGNHGDLARLVASADDAVAAVEAAKTRRLLQAHHPPATPTDDDASAFWLLRERRFAEVEELLVAGALRATAAEAGTGLTALMLAVSTGSLSTVAALLGAGAHPDAETPAGATAAFFAWDAWRATKTALAEARAKSRRLAVQLLTALLAGGADPNHADGGGGTLLHRAATYGHDDAALLLLRYGGDPAQADARGESPADAAARHGHPPVARLLRLWGPIRRVQAAEDFKRAWRGALAAARGGGAEAAAQLLRRVGAPVSNTSAQAALAAEGLLPTAGSGGAGAGPHTAPAAAAAAAQTALLWGGAHTPAAADVDEMLRRYAVQAELRARRRERQDAEAASTGKRQPALVPGDYDAELDAVREAEAAGNDDEGHADDGAGAGGGGGGSTTGADDGSRQQLRPPQRVVDVVDTHGRDGDGNDDDADDAQEGATSAATTAAAGVLNNMLRRKLLRQTYDKKVVARGAADAVRHARGAGSAGGTSSGGRIGDFGFGSLDVQALVGVANACTGKGGGDADAAAPSTLLARRHRSALAVAQDAPEHGSLYRHDIHGVPYARRGALQSTTLTASRVRVVPGRTALDATTAAAVAGGDALERILVGDEPQHHQPGDSGMQHLLPLLTDGSAAADGGDAGATTGTAFLGAHFAPIPAVDPALLPAQARERLERQQQQQHRAASTTTQPAASSSAAAAASEAPALKDRRVRGLLRDAALAAKEGVAAAEEARAATARTPSRNAARAAAAAELLGRGVGTPGDLVTAVAARVQSAAGAAPSVQRRHSSVQHPLPPTPPAVAGDVPFAVAKAAAVQRLADLSMDPRVTKPRQRARNGQGAGAAAEAGAGVAAAGHGLGLVAGWPLHVPGPLPAGDGGTAGEGGTASATSLVSLATVDSLARRAGDRGGLAFYARQAASTRAVRLARRAELQAAGQPVPPSRDHRYDVAPPRDAAAAAAARAAAVKSFAVDAARGPRPTPAGAASARLAVTAPSSLAAASGGGLQR